MGSLLHPFVNIYPLRTRELPLAAIQLGGYYTFISKGSSLKRAAPRKPNVPERSAGRSPDLADPGAERFSQTLACRENTTRLLAQAGKLSLKLSYPLRAAGKLLASFQGVVTFLEWGWGGTFTGTQAIQEGKHTD